MRTSYEATVRDCKQGTSVKPSEVARTEHSTDRPLADYCYCFRPRSHVFSSILYVHVLFYQCSVSVNPMYLQLRSGLTDPRMLSCLSARLPCSFPGCGSVLDQQSGVAAKRSKNTIAVPSL